MDRRSRKALLAEARAHLGRGTDGGDTRASALALVVIAETLWLQGGQDGPGSTGVLTQPVVQTSDKPVE